MAANLHATAFVLGDRGLMTTGASGAGKTTLALFLVDRAAAQGRFAALVADDQVFIERRSGSLIVRRPPSVAGLAERRGPGPLPVRSVSAARIDGVVELVPPGHAPRIEDEPVAGVAGVSLPRLRLAADNVVAAAMAVEAWLRNGFAVAR